MAEPVRCGKDDGGVVDARAIQRVTSVANRVWGNREHQVVRKSDEFVSVEWICLAIFVTCGLIALPFVKDAFIVQQIWSTMCATFGITS